MGPKRKQGNDEAQQTLLGFFQSPSHSSTPSTSENDLSPSKSTHSAFSYEESNSETRPKAKKSRKYNKDWEKLFSWVAFDEESKSMYCTLCTDAKKVNSMVKSVQCTNFQQSTLSRHASLPEHKMLVEAPVLQKDLESIRKRQDSKHDVAVKILFKALHWLVAEDIALVKFKSLLEFLHELAESGHSLGDLSVLKMSNINYDSAYTATNLLQSMASVAEEDLQNELTNSPVVTALADESTDISNHKRLVLYTQIIEEWQLVKQVVIAEQYPRDSMHQLWSLIVKYHPEFPNLNILAKLALTSSVHTAGCERGFSVQNRILTTFRNRLNIDTQHCLMMLKLDSHSRLTFNFDLALLKWKKTKDRRLYELKYKQK